MDYFSKEEFNLNESRILQSITKRDNVTGFRVAT